ANGIKVAEGDGAEPVDADVDAVGLVTPGDVEIFTARRAAADEDGVVAFVDQGFHAFDGGVVANVDAHIKDRVALIGEDLFREAEGRDIRPHQAAGFSVFFENGDGITVRHQVVGNGQ